MRHHNFKNHKVALAAACGKPAAALAVAAVPATAVPDVAGAAAAAAALDVAGAAAAAPASAAPASAAPATGTTREPGVGLDLIVRGVVEAGSAKAKALLRLYLHSRKVRAAARALAEALAESRDVWSWPGDRLPVGAEMSQQVEKLTRRLKLETEAHNRLEALFKTADLGRSAPAV